MNIIEIIKKRKSTRTFNQVSITPADKRDLESFIIENSKGLENKVVNFKIIEKNSADNQMKPDLGMIKGHNNYILGISESTVASRVNYGYLMEKVVLKVTEMNMSTCWVGYFDYTYFNEVSLKDGFDIPGIIVVGYPEKRQTIQEKLARFTVNAQKRHGWDKLFFNYKLKTPLDPEYVMKYSDSLEMVRLAPSSGNTQPWRLFYDDVAHEFHFFKKIISKRYELRGLHDIDMGIAMSHFELTSLYKNLSGNWIKHTNENVVPINDLQYIMTWRCG